MAATKIMRKVAKSLKNITAELIMTDHVVTLREEHTLSEVTHLMLRERISGVPVVDKKGRVTGLLSLPIIFEKLLEISGEKDRNMAQRIVDYKYTPISKVMARRLVTIKKDTTILEMIHFLNKRDINTFMVTHRGKLLGVVSKHDILNAVFAL